MGSSVKNYFLSTVILMLNLMTLKHFVGKEVNSF